MEEHMNKLSWGTVSIIFGSVLLSIELYVPRLIIGLKSFDFFNADSVKQAMLISKGLIIYGFILVIIYFIQEYKKK